MKYNIAIVGINSLVARQILNFLNDRKFPVNFIKPLVIEQVQERYISFQGADYVIDKARDSLFRGMDFIFLVDEEKAKDKFASTIAKHNGIIIDNSSSSKKDNEIPLIIPEINSECIRLGSKILATPSPDSIFLSLALKPIYNRVGLKKITASVYQCSFEKTEEKAFNIIPYVGKPDKNNYTDKEIAIEEEVKRIIGEPQLVVCVTCIRIPTFCVNFISVNIETKKKVYAEEVREWFYSAPCVKVLDDIEKQIYPTIKDAEGKNDIFVGRIRNSHQMENCIDMVIVGDTLRKGSALNIVQIAEEVIKIRERHSYYQSHVGPHFFKQEW